MGGSLGECHRARGGKGFAELVEPVSYGAVDNGVADGDRHPADHRGVDLHADFDGMSDRAAQRGGKPFALAVVELDGGAHLRHTPAALLGRELGEPFECADEVPNVARLEHVADEPASGRLRPASKQILH